VKLTPVNSSNMHSAGHDHTGQYVRFHVRGCPRTRKPADGAAAERCACEGSPIYHYAGVPAELHQLMMVAPSPGSFHHAQIKTMKDPRTGALLLYPGILKVEDPIR
jgi:hypothetical protein